MTAGGYVRHVFIIGAKSVGQYGGYETFVDRLTERHRDEPAIRYHIACKANGDGCMDESKLSGVTVLARDADGAVSEFLYHNAHIFKIRCPGIGPAVAVYYDRAAVLYALSYCQEHEIHAPVFYILTCRIGLFIDGLVKKIHAAGGTYMLNPDGHEWKRAKWPAPVRKYWKWSEGKMVRAADLVICDSVHIGQYIRETSGHPATTYISYGADMVPSVLKDDDPAFSGWLSENGLEPGNYYLVVGRFVPENNYETMIREFMNSGTRKKLALVTNLNGKLRKKLEETLHFSEDPRIRFAGTVYDRELLKKVREQAYGYLHGHEVGGTNPSLLEALWSTKLNLLLSVSFNREAGQDAALYWTKEEGSLSGLIDRADRMSEEEREEYDRRSKERIRAAYSWRQIAEQYKRCFLEGRGDAEA